MKGIRRMKPDDRLLAVESLIDGAAHGGDTWTPILEVTYRTHRTGEPKTERFTAVGVAYNDNGTSFGELIVQSAYPTQRPHLMRGISLALIDAIEMPT